jgi:hypothetical protein
MLPPKDRLKICFAHAAYRLGERVEATLVNQVV